MKRQQREQKQKQKQKQQNPITDDINNKEQKQHSHSHFQLQQKVKQRNRQQGPAPPQPKQQQQQQQQQQTEKNFIHGLQKCNTPYQVLSYVRDFFPYRLQEFDDDDAIHYYRNRIRRYGNVSSSSRSSSSNINIDIDNGKNDDNNNNTNIDDGGNRTAQLTSLILVRLSKQMVALDNTQYDGTVNAEDDRCWNERLLTPSNTRTLKRVVHTLAHELSSFLLSLVPPPPSTSTSTSTSTNHRHDTTNYHTMIDACVEGFKATSVIARILSSSPPSSSSSSSSSSSLLPPSYLPDF